MSKPTNELQLAETFLLDHTNLLVMWLVRHLPPKEDTLLEHEHLMQKCKGLVERHEHTNAGKDFVSLAELAAYSIRLLRMYVEDGQLTEKRLFELIDERVKQHESLSGGNGASYAAPQN